MTDILNDLYRAMDLMDKIGPPAKVEIWVSDYAPTHDKDGVKIAGFMFSAMDEPGKYFPAMRRSFLPDTEKILMIHTSVFDELKEQILKSGIPIFLPGGVRVGNEADR